MGEKNTVYILENGELAKVEDECFEQIEYLEETHDDQQLYETEKPVEDSKSDKNQDIKIINPNEFQQFMPCTVPENDCVLNYGTQKWPPEIEPFKRHCPKDKKNEQMQAKIDYLKTKTHFYKQEQKRLCLEQTVMLNQIKNISLEIALLENNM